MAAAALAAVSMLTYSAGYFPAKLIPQDSIITAEAAKQKSEGTFISLGNTSSTDTNSFYGWLNTYFEHEPDLDYLNDDTVKAFRIKGFKSGYTSFIIPAPYYDEDTGKTYSVTKIGRDYSSQLTNRANVESVHIPYTVEYIGAYTFTGATNLTHVYTYRSEYSNRGRNTNVSESKLKKIYDCAFSGCSALKEISIWSDGSFDNLTEIGMRAFSGCTALTKFNVPNSVKTIGIEAFKESGLTTITLNADSSALTTVGKDAFKDTALTTGYVTKNMTDNPYDGIPTLTQYVVADGQVAGYYAIDGVLCKTTDSVKSLAAFPAAKAVTDYTIPKEIDSIGGYAFNKVNNENLSVTIPATVTKVNPCAFYDGKLKNITINGAPTIYDYFMWETNLTGTLTINGEARWNKDSESAYWFHHCNINKVVFTDKFTWRLPDEPISNGQKFQLFGVSTKDSDGYYKYHDEYNYAHMKANYYNSIDTVEIQGKWNLRTANGEYFEFGEHKFQGVKNVKFTDPDCEIAPMMFDGAVELETVQLPADLKEIPRYAFSYTYSLKELNIPDTVTTIGACAFQNTGLKSLVVPDGVTSIGENAFQMWGTKSLRDDEFVTQFKDLYLSPSLTYDSMSKMNFGNSDNTGITLDESEKPYPVKLHGVAGSGAQEYADKYDNVTFVAMTNLDDFELYSFNGSTSLGHDTGIDGTFYYYASPGDQPDFSFSKDGTVYDSDYFQIVDYNLNSDVNWYDIISRDINTYGHKIIYFVDGQGSKASCANGAHYFNERVVKTLAPTCTEGGYSYYECIYCGEKKKIANTETAALGHDWGEWDANNDRTCKRCEAKEHKPTVSFDEATGVLTLLAGNVDKADVQAYAENEAVKSVVAEEGAILPESCLAMFKNYKATSIDLTNANTSAVTDMSCMFMQCYELTDLNLNGFDTSNVTEMSDMFYGCKALVSLDLSSFDTSKVTKTDSMFQACFEITTIYVSDKWNMANVTNSTYMFAQSQKLVGGNGTKQKDVSTDATYARPDLEGQKGLLTINILAVAAKAATCGAAGNSAYYKNNVNGKYYSDVACTTEITLESTVIPATGKHTWGTPEGGCHTCTVCGAKEAVEEFKGMTVTSSDVTKTGFKLSWNAIPEPYEIKIAIAYDDIADFGSADIAAALTETEQMMNSGTKTGDEVVAYITEKYGAAAGKFTQKLVSDDKGLDLSENIEGDKTDFTWAKFHDLAPDTLYTFAFAIEGCSPDKWGIIQVKTLGDHVHTWGEPVYKWAEDLSEVAATAVCTADPTHTVSETVKTTKQEIPATFEAAGKMIYTAVFENKELFKTQTMEVEIPQLTTSAAVTQPVTTVSEAVTTTAPETTTAPLNVSTTTSVSTTSVPVTDTSSTTSTTSTTSAPVTDTGSTTSSTQTTSAPVTDTGSTTSSTQTTSAPVTDTGSTTSSTQTTSAPVSDTGSTTSATGTTSTPVTDTGSTTSSTQTTSAPVTDTGSTTSSTQTTSAPVTDTGSTTSSTQTTSAPVTDTGSTTSSTQTTSAPVTDTGSTTSSTQTTSAPVSDTGSTTSSTQTTSAPVTDTGSTTSSTQTTSAPVSDTGSTTSSTQTTSAPVTDTGSTTSATQTTSAPVTDTGSTTSSTQTTSAPVTNTGSTTSGTQTTSAIQTGEAGTSTTTTTTTTGNGTGEPELRPDMIGDLDKDGKAIATDAAMLLKLYAELSSGSRDATTEEIYICDVNRNSKIEAGDAAFILKYYAEASGGYDKTIDVYLKEVLKIAI